MCAAKIVWSVSSSVPKRGLKLEYALVGGVACVNRGLQLMPYQVG